MVLGPGSALGLQPLVLVLRLVGLDLTALSIVLCFWSLLLSPWSAVIGLGLGPMTLVIGHRSWVLAAHGTFILRRSSRDAHMGSDPFLPLQPFLPAPPPPPITTIPH